MDPKRKKNLIVLAIVVVFSLFVLKTCFDEYNPKPNSKIENNLSKLDGSYTKFRNYIEENLNDPSSFEHVETRYKDNNDGTATVWMKYRGKNAFNATLTKIAKCTMDVNTGEFSNVIIE